MPARMGPVFSLAIVAAILSAFFLGKRFAATEPATSGRIAPAVESAAAARNSAAIATLQKRIDAISRHLAGFPNPAPSEPTPDLRPGLEDLAMRLEQLEQAVQKLTPGAGKLSVDRREEIQAGFAGDLRNLQEASRATQFASAESQFELDQGAPLGDFSGTVADALAAADGIDLKNLECRSSICKVTYSRTGSSASDGQAEDEFELVDQLVGAADKSEVEVRYARDPYGNQVMYIQAR